MAGDLSSPNRFLQGQHVSDARALLLSVFTGKVLSKFDLAVKFAPLVQTDTPAQGSTKGVFYKVGHASGGYHSPGVELLGRSIPTTKIEIDADDILVSDFAVADLDAMLTNFNASEKFAGAAAHFLAKTLDKNILRMLILASRAAADGPFPGGNSITDASLINSGAIDGKAWIDAFREARIKFRETVNLPDEVALYAAVNARVFDAMRFATNSKGMYIFPQAAEAAMAPSTLAVEGITVHWTNNMPSGDESADTDVYGKYRGNWTNTKSIVWASEAVGVTQVMDITYETTRDVRRLEDFTVYKMMSGGGTVSPEMAMELKVA